MSAILTNARSLFLVLAALGVLFAWSVQPCAAAMQGSVKQVAPAETRRASRPPSELGNRKVTFEMRDMPWKQVFEWLSDETGLPFITTCTPTGTFTFIAPKGSRRVFTIREVVDILNQALIKQQLLLVRKKHCFTVVASDGILDLTVLRRITVDELDQHGNSEAVSAVIQLTRRGAENEDSVVKKMLGLCGDAAPDSLAPVTGQAHNQKQEPGTQDAAVASLGGK